MADNFLRLSGIVVDQLSFKKSPSGVTHCSFQIEHKSLQEEAGLPRSVFCYMHIIASGKLADQLKNKLLKGMQIRISGFIAYQKSTTNNGKIVLHAQYIEQI